MNCISITPFLLMKGIGFVFWFGQNSNILDTNNCSAFFYCNAFIRCRFFFQKVASAIHCNGHFLLTTFEEMTTEENNHSGIWQLESGNWVKEIGKKGKSGKWNEGKWLLKKMSFWRYVFRRNVFPRKGVSRKCHRFAVAILAYFCKYYYFQKHQ